VFTFLMAVEGRREATVAAIGWRREPGRQPVGLRLDVDF